ncbi:cytochrome c maturation protein CcmE [Kangiella sediminilitoris]|uniref:Cytochrome c-type biogenesis protein CcmE n=1 Tax=Kangiella sediminilitoris TaxID=1144748 RepID=A0A1B3B9T8_9GAMM|nr:cytochrome c maturation protein CcmE [Kangiella sediminilitoris]AOE49569.1 cytochrome C biogenesis protein CcmC [Kangiella sediminilitoris]
MKAHRRNKLIAILAGLTLLAGAVALVLFALSENINHFYPPTEVAQGKAPMDKTIRVGGLVSYNSVKRAEDGLNVEFQITDNQNTMMIQYEGILPDLFKEGQGVIAEGKLVEADRLVATKVLAKHDEKYMPPEIEQSLEKYGHPVKSKKAEY